MATASASAPAPSPADIASSILDFSDAEFAAAPALDVHTREVRLLDTAFVGIAIAAQRRIDVGAQAQLPIALAIRCDGERDWDLPLSDNCLLVATDMLSGRASVVPALVSPKVLESRHGALPARAGPVRPPADELAGHGAQLGWTEARSRVEMPWRRGAWSFGLVHFDWVSNRADVMLEGGPAAPAAPVPGAVNRLPAAQGAGASYLRSNRTPVAPVQGVAFRVEPDERGARVKLQLDAAFAMPLRPHAVAAGGVTLAEGGQARPVAAIVPMTLLLVGANTVYPWARELAVPVYGPPAQPGEAVQGSLSLDAFAEAPAPGPGTFACYVVLDGAIHGPQTIQLTR